MYFEGELPTVAYGNCNNNGNSWNNDFAWIIGLALVGGLFGGWGNGGAFGGGGGGRGGYGYGYGFCGSPCATQADVRDAVDQQTLISKIDQQTYGLADSFNSLSNILNSNFRGVDNAICNLGYNIATQFAGVDKSFCTLGYQTQAGFNSLANQIAQCCCDTRSAIADVKYANERNTCDIINNANAQTRAILDYLTGEKISALQAENSGLKAQISNDRQSAYIIDKLSPCPKPAYLTCNPNAPVNYSINYGNPCGCGCN